MACAGQVLPLLTSLSSGQPRPFAQCCSRRRSSSLGKPELQRIPGLRVNGCSLHSVQTEVGLPSPLGELFKLRCETAVFSHLMKTHKHSPFLTPPKFVPRTTQVSWGYLPQPMAVVPWYGCPSVSPSSSTSLLLQTKGWENFSAPFSECLCHSSFHLCCLCSKHSSGCTSPTILGGQDKLLALRPHGCPLPFHQRDCHFLFPTSSSTPQGTPQKIPCGM